MGCECAMAGWCERHRIVKSPHLLKLCQTNDSYFRAWEEGRGPRQDRTGEPQKIHKPDPVCVHRGDIMGTAECGCAGKPKVYQCDLHSFAMDRKLKPGKVPVAMRDGKQFIDMKYCNACDDFATAKAIYPAIKTRSLVQHIVTVEDLSRDTIALTQTIASNHPDVSAIAGVPRSGMRVACDVAIRLGVPLYEASYEGLRACGGGGGSRIRNGAIHGHRKSFSGPIVVVDDSICSGMSLRELRKVPELADLPTYVIYAASPGRKLITGYVHAMELPHWFDWNFLNNGQILSQRRVGVDFDGVLCGDCLPADDDDGERYAAWMANVQPIRFPRDYRVPFIITARREAYRSITEAWLAKYRINYGTLIMYPGTFAERQQCDIGQWKAAECDRAGVGLFVESDYRQATRIAELRQRPVISIERAAGN